MALAGGNGWFGGGVRGYGRRVFVVNPAGQLVAAGDEASAALISQIRPRPLDHHDQAIAESDEKEDVDEEPGEPGKVSGDFEFADLGDGGGASNRGATAFVVIIKIAAWLIFQVAGDGFGNPVALLDGDGGDSGKHLAVCVFQSCEVAEDEHFRVPWNAEVGLNQHAAGAVKGDT